MELGLGLLLPEDFNNLNWIGDGPYSAWFDQDEASKFGIYSAWQDSINFTGDKKNVELALVVDEGGNGICIILDKSTISVEKTKEGIIFSQILTSAGKGNKTSNQLSLKMLEASEIETVSGHFRIKPINGTNNNEFINGLFHLR